jgi:aminobenzoyl-glutamate transport protein
MNSQKSEQIEKSKKPMEKFIKAVERGGNLLPHPVTLFTILAIFVLVLSYFLAKANVSVTYMEASRVATEEVTETTVSVVNLLSRTELQGIMAGFVNTFITFFPIGIVIVMMLGIGVADQSGLIKALMTKLVLGAPDYLVTYIVALVGVCANIASDAGIVFSPAIGATIFYALGRHPVAGIMTGYAAAYGGFTANMFIAGTDALLAGITQSVATSFGIDAPVHPLMNWYIMAFSTLIIALIVTMVTEKIITPLLGKFDPEDTSLITGRDEEFTVSKIESKGLKAAGIVALIYIGIILLLTVPTNGFFRSDEGKILPSSPLISSILFILFFFFLTTGIAYGKTAGTVKTGNDVAKFLQKGLEGVSGFIVVCLPASMFITWFNKSNISTILAIKGTELLQRINLPTIPMLILFILFCGVVNLFITSGTSKWMLLAPVFVPMFAMMGVAPAATQMAYRIADSAIDLISPLSAYIPVVLGMMEKYKNKGQKLGIGTVISLSMPYSMMIFVFWIIVYSVWLFLDLPLGPGVSAFM